MGSCGNNVTKHESGGESTQHDIQFKHRRKRNQKDKEQQGNPYRCLGRGSSLGVEEPVQRIAILYRFGSHQGNPDTEEEQPSQNGGGLPGGPGGQKNGYAEYHGHFPPGAIGKDEVPDAGAHEAALFENRHERPQCGGGEQQGRSQDAFPSLCKNRDSHSGANGQDKGDNPRIQPVTSIFPGNRFRVDFKSCQKKQQGTSHF